MAAYFQTVTTTQPTAALGILAPPGTVPLSQLTLDPNASVIPARPPIILIDSPDPRWQLNDADLQPSSVAASIAQGQMNFRLSQMTSETSTVSVTSQPMYRLRDSAVLWQNASFPAYWGDPGSIVARASLVGSSSGHSIDVTFSDGQITVSHTDSGVTTTDFINPLNAPIPGRARTGDVQTFQYIRIESDGVGDTFSVYASVDGLVWALLVRQTMSADMQGAFVHSTLVFSMTASGSSGAGAWVVGSINGTLQAANYPGLYLQSEDQAGFAYNAGVWNQFGPPLDGPRSGYTYDPINQYYKDSSGGVHYNWVTGLCYARDDPNTVYAVANAHALLFISHDGGLHWSAKPMPFAVQVPQPSGADPSAPLSAMGMFNLASPHAGEVSVLAYAQNLALNPGIYRSVDEGTSWTRIVQFTPDPTNLPLPAPQRVLGAGGMAGGSSSKLWWAQQTDAQHLAPPPPGSDAPRWNVIWSNSMAWAIHINDPPEDQPVFTIPPLSLSQIVVTNDDGTTTTVRPARAYVALSTPGIWVPNIAGQPLVLWENGMQTSWQDPIIDGIYGPVGWASHVLPSLFWQPGTVSDADVAEFWAKTADNYNYNLQVTAFQRQNPGVPLPPDLALPDMGGYNGAWMQVGYLSTTGDLVDPVNAPAAVGSGSLALDYMLTVTPDHPENSAQVFQGLIADLPPEGGKIHPLMIGDFVPLRSSTDPVTTERMSEMDLSGILSVVVVDVEAADMPLYLALAGTDSIMGGKSISASGAYRAVGGGYWDYLTNPSTGELLGDPPAYVPDSKLVGPPGHEQLANYTRFIHPTWEYGEFPNTPDPPGFPVTVTIAPTYTPLGDPGTREAYGGVILATQVVFGDSLPPIPSGWTEVTSTDVALVEGSGTAGSIPIIGPGSQYKAGRGIFMQFGETGQWVGVSREYLHRTVDFTISPMRQRVLMCPFSGDPPVTVSFDRGPQPYWFVAATFGVFWRAVSTTPAPIVSTTWAIKRANDDGSAPETVATLVFPDSGPTSGTLQIRPHDDELCLVSSYAEQGVWRVLAGSGAAPLWPAAMQGTARPWDAIALDANTFIAVTNAVPPPPPVTP